MIFDKVLRSRRSIRVFEKKKVPIDMIRKIIDAARLSPSAKNRQPWRFVLMKESEKKKMVAEMRLLEKSQNEKGNTIRETADILESAPAVIAVHAEGTSYSDTLAIGGAMYAMCLKATDLDLGSLWACDTDILKKRSQYSDLAGVIALGSPAIKPENPGRKEITEISNLVMKKKKTMPVVDPLPDAKLGKCKYFFVSYSHKDSDCVYSDIVEMKKHGFPLWYDKALLVGDKWDDKALEYLNNKNCTMFLWYISPNSLSSEPVYKEFKAAKEKADRNEMTIVPILIGEKSVPEILKSLRKNKHKEKADAYAAVLGEGNERLYAARSTNPESLDHIQDIIKACKENKIIDISEVYDDYGYEIAEEGAIITKYNGTARRVKLPDSISGFPVVEIGECAFMNNHTIEKVELPNTLRIIGAGAFRNTALKEVTIPDSVEEIKQACFRDCADLEKVVLPSGLKVLTEALFRGCGKLTEVVVPKGVTEMQEAVFMHCVSIEEIILPDVLAKVTDGGFFGCVSLKKLVIPSTVKGLESWSFNTSPYLKQIKVGNHIFGKKETE